MAAKKKPLSAPLPPSAQEAARLFSQVVPYLCIAHQVGGRVRLKLDAAAMPALLNGGGERLGRLFGALPGVRGIALNALARSCVVEYDNTVIPDAAWPDLLAGRASASADTLLGLIARAVPDLSSSPPGHGGSEAVSRGQAIPSSRKEKS